jgi:translation initiation factor 1
MQRQAMKKVHTFRGVVLERPVRPPPARPAASGPPKIRVGRETAGRGGKGVTVITGLPLAPAQLEELAGRLKRSCGAGGAARDGKIEIQGEHRDRLVAELVRLGYDARKAGG